MKSYRDKPAFVCIPAFDTPGRADASGAFQPEARRLVSALRCNATTKMFDSNRALPDRRYEVIPAIEKVQGAALIAFLCHGWRDGIQAGWNLARVDDLAHRLVLASTTSATVALFCCDTGRNQDGERKDDVAVGPGGKGGFASALFVGMRAKGWRGQLWAHPTTAHTTKNPHVRIFRQDDDPELGDWAVEPHSALWRKWKAALQNTEFRFRMLECESGEEIAERLTRLA